MDSLYAAFIAGAGLGASLIIAIGAQNAFVLRNGIVRSHVLAIVATCVLCDWLLILAGTLGFGAVVEAFPGFIVVATWGGVAFLAVYGALSFRRALVPEVLGGDVAGPAPLSSTYAAVVATLAISLLNPHVYLDTVVLLGGVAASQPIPERWWFVAGAWTASAAWFAALGFGARLLAPAFRRPGTWRALDIGIGVVMWSIAVGLALSL